MVNFFHVKVTKIHAKLLIASHFYEFEVAEQIYRGFSDSWETYKKH